MRTGFTTGSCAAAAAKAAACMLLSGHEQTKIRIATPAGETYEPAVEEIRMGETFACCAVRKDAGDDPDITNGVRIFAMVRFAEKEEALSAGRNGERVIIEGGEGIGRVTRPGLDQPVGNAAINSVPRRMIRSEVEEVMDLFDCPDPLFVEISVPGGKELAEKTFNPRLGIEGGISVIGTTGIVEPMSTKALLDTIRVELSQLRAMGYETAVISPGNYGLSFMKQHYDYDLDRAVKCANFIGETIDMAKDLGFMRLLLCGHVGKLIKVSGGIMNTHSKEADCRMELLAAAAIRCGADSRALSDILSCVSTEEAIEVLQREGIAEQCFSHIMERIGFYLEKRAGEGMETAAIVYSNAFGLLGQTKKAEAFLEEAKKGPAA